MVQNFINIPQCGTLLGQSRNRIGKQSVFNYVKHIHEASYQYTTEETASVPCSVHAQFKPRLEDTILIRDSAGIPFIPVFQGYKQIRELNNQEISSHTIKLIIQKILKKKL
jgi:hypothetical protein